jgi:hypothetical protein
MEAHFLALVLAVASQGKPETSEHVRLKFVGLTENSVRAVVESLGMLPSVHLDAKPTKDKPIAELSFDPSKTQLGDIAVAIANSARPNQKVAAPSTVLVLRYMRLDTSPLADDIYLPRRVGPVLESLKGIDAKKSELDTTNKELLLWLDNRGGVRLDALRKAFDFLALK